MLQNSNLQFTNATRLNDPFDCHPALFNYSNVPFDSLYLGINIDKEEKEKIIKVAKERNPKIKIYQMTIAPEAFRLKGELI